MSVYADILEFSEERPDWQRDALRRVVSGGELNEDDLDDLEAMLRSKVGLLERADVSPEPLTAAHLPPLEDAADTVRLIRLEQLENVNRLRADQSLPFALDGLTVVFGYNGSGKTGYCRVLKRLCRVRGGVERRDVRGNVYEEVQGPARAQISYRVGDGEREDVQWTAGDESPTELSAISVFDARTVPIYANEQNRLEWLPRGLSVLRELGDACTLLRDRFEREMKEVRRAFEAVSLPIDDETEVGRLVGRITLQKSDAPLPVEEDLETAASWSDDDGATLEGLRLEAAWTPSTIAERCERKYGALSELGDEVKEARELLSDEALEQYEGLLEAQRTAQATAKLAAEEAFKDEPLESVGSEPWHHLFAHAREYSQLVYPDRDFPVTGEDGRCVLCQQPLTEEAADRLRRFEDFVQNRAEREKERAESAVESAREELDEVLSRRASELENVVDGVDELVSDEEDVVVRLPQAYEALKSRRDAAAALLDGERETLIEEEEPPELPDLDAGDIDSLVNRLREEAEAQRRAEAGEEEGPSIQERVRELEDRKTLSENLESVLDLRRLASQYRRLQRCHQACDTTAISRRNTTLRRTYLTERMANALDDELADLGLGYLTLEAEDRSVRGASEIGFSLDTVQPVENRDVLSDGEFQALALGAFLAEMETLEGQSGMILDDPVSSFDHRNIGRIARRLVDEADEGRQVVVFTHNIVFYQELYSVAAEEEVPVTRHWIRGGEVDGFGVISQGDVPWEAKKVNHRLAELEHEVLPDIRRIGDTESDEYRKAVDGFYNDLRRSWERVVEEVLFGEVVKRYRKSIQTNRLNGVEVTDEDYRRIDRGMTRCSEFTGHDRAGPVDRPYPSPDELEADLEELRDYRSELNRRSNEARERRGDSGPPRGTTG